MNPTKITAEAVHCKEQNGKLVISAWASVPVVDRSSEYIDAKAFDLTEFNTNPVYLWCHDRKSLPLGAVNNLRARVYNGNGSGLYGEFQHDPKYDFAVKVYESYRQGFLRGFSIGFKVDASEYMRPVQVAKLGLNPETTRVTEFTACRLYEISAVPVPDNQAALAEPVVKSLLAEVPLFMKQKIMDAVPARSTVAMSLFKTK